MAESTTETVPAAFWWLQSNTRAWMCVTKSMRSCTHVAYGVDCWYGFSPTCLAYFVQLIQWVCWWVEAAATWPKWYTSSARQKSHTWLWWTTCGDHVTGDWEPRTVMIIGSCGHVGYGLCWGNTVTRCGSCAGIDCLPIVLMVVWVGMLWGHLLPEKRCLWQCPMCWIWHLLGCDQFSSYLGKPTSRLDPFSEPASYNTCKGLDEVMSTLWGVSSKLLSKQLWGHW